jgi:hypothetical protein
MIETENQAQLYVRFFLRGKGVDPGIITETLKITPSYSFKEGDLFGMRKKHVREYGFWSFDSEKQVPSYDLETHIRWILERLESVQTELDFLIKQENIHAEITIVFHLFSREWSESIPTILLNRIGKLNIALGVSLYHLSYSEEE